MAFTKEQQEAIDTEGKNIIVSAGAGSGKTAVLTARVLRKLLSGIDVDHLLVLTFTNEAASEMKNRIREAIIQNKLYDQLASLAGAQITTFDSFALSIVKKYHYTLNISQDIKIIDKDIITIYKRKILDQIFENKYGNSSFDKFISDYCLKDDKSIKLFIIELSNKLDLLVNKEEYLNNYLNDFYSEKNINILINKYLEIIKENIIELKEISEDLINYLPDSLIDKLSQYLRPLFNGLNYSDYLSFIKLPTIRFTKLPPEALPIKEELKAKIDEIKELLRYSDEEEIIESIASTKDNIKIIIDIIRELDNHVTAYKNKYSSYEFNDIAHMAINIVKNNEDIRNEIKYYYNEIMIDEYQDTSSIQEEFIKYIENNNVYMVGDIKQSIYRFRNANPSIFENKYKEYSKGNNGIKIDLLKNFRSRKETLYNINEIFNLTMDENIGNANYLKEHNMIYGLEDYDKEETNQNNYLEIYNYQIDSEKSETPEEKELFLISKDIQEKIANNYLVFDKKTKKIRPITYSDICIITDRNKYLPMYKKILEYNEIPSVIYMDETLTNDIVILVIKNLIHLTYLVNNNIYDNVFKYLYTSVARSFIFCYKDNTIWTHITNKNYYQSDIIKLCQTIDINEPLPKVIHNILNTFNVYEKLTTLTDIEKNMVRISNLIDIANNLSKLNYSIIDFIEYLNTTIDMNLSVKYSIKESTENAVKIMNIHKSKGLEFSLCYFTGMHNKFTIKEISNKFLISNKYGIIIPYLKNNELKNNILKDLYKKEYLEEEISEKIRLFYVSLTRCREKMIILASLDEESEKYNHLVPQNKRIKYRSFLDIINSLSIINKYKVDKDITYNKKYQKVNIKELEKTNNKNTIQKITLNIPSQKITSKHFSKENHKLISQEEQLAMEYGTKIHETLEYADFKNSHNKIIQNLLNQIDNNYINIYHEYEFIYNEDNIMYNGIIDLMIEYDNKIYIIDYKLKDITEKEYLHQLKGYQKYIENITNKTVTTYLYSLLDNNLKEVKYEK